MPTSTHARLVGLCAVGDRKLRDSRQASRVLPVAGRTVHGRRLERRRDRIGAASNYTRRMDCPRP